MKRFHAKPYGLTFAALGALLLPAAAGATTIYSNTGALNITGGGADVNQSVWAADSFLTGGSSSSLSDVILALEAVSGATGTLTVSLYSATNGAPPAPLTSIATLGTIADSSLSTSTFTDETFDVTGVTLAANTEYYVVLSGSTSGDDTGPFDAIWERSNSNSGTGISGQYHAGYISGTGWGVDGNLGDFEPLIMQVDTGSATPEPSTLFGLIGGLAAIAVVKLRRRI